MKKIFLISFLAIFLSSVGWAKDLDCQVCGMKIGEKAPNHFVLKKEKGSDSLHVCSIPCVQKGRKNAPGYIKTEVSDFNHPGKLLDGNRAFFLVKSKNIKKVTDNHNPNHCYDNKCG